jgi:hypothetical protein
MSRVPERIDVVAAAIVGRIGHAVSGAVGLHSARLREAARPPTRSQSKSSSARSADAHDGDHLVVAYPHVGAYAWGTVKQKLDRLHSAHLAAVP